MKKIKIKKIWKNKMLKNISRSNLPRINRRNSTAKRKEKQIKERVTLGNNLADIREVVFKSW